MAELTLVEAINDCFHVEFSRDENVLVMGEDVGRRRRRFRCHGGAARQVRPERAASTRRSPRPGSLGTAIGLCMARWRPVCEMQYDAFSYPALDQLITHVGRYRWRAGGKMGFPSRVRMPYGGVSARPSCTTILRRPTTCTPGVKVAIRRLRAPQKACSRRQFAITDPVIIFEPQAPLPVLAMRGESARGLDRRPSHSGRRARFVRERTGTLVAYGCMVPLRGAGRGCVRRRASAETLDIRSLKPL